MKRALLYLHGFASGPRSKKGLAFDAHMSARGYAVERLDLRLPDRDHLRVSAMIDAARARIAAAGDVLVVGSSLGGLVASYASQGAAGVVGLVLMAPAFGFVRRLGARLGEAFLDRWRAGEPFLADDHAGGPPLAIDYGFYTDATSVEDAPVVVAAPLLLFHGTRDDAVPIAGSRAFAAQRGAEHARRSPLEFVEVDDGHELTACLPLLLERSEAFAERCFAARAAAGAAAG